ncbi:MAG: hypothetical protein ABFD60_03235 [Bryobacteraceae bacterium]
MSCYIASTNNRFYTAVEQSYGTVPAIDATNRFPAVKLSIKQEPDRVERQDKTGSRTFFGLPAHTRQETTFQLRTYMTGWSDQTKEPAYGPLFQSALGGAPTLFAGATTGVGSEGKTLCFSAAHGLAPGQAVTFGGEIRFVAAVIDTTSVLLNAAFTVLPSEGSPIGASATYSPTTKLKSISIFDYWTPSTAVQRVLCGAGVDTLKIVVNGDFHEFQFEGQAQDVIDSASFTSGQGKLESFPSEPELGAFDYTIIPGHLGQAWLGVMPDRFYTLTEAQVSIGNGIDLRAKEFGATGPRCIVGDMRDIEVDFSLFEVDDEATTALYQAARQRSPIEMFFQLGQEAGQLFGVYMKSVVPEVPEFDDSETRLAWNFSKCRAQGSLDDEIYVAFG